MPRLIAKLFPIQKLILCCYQWLKGFCAAIEGWRRIGLRRRQGCLGLLGIVLLSSWAFPDDSVISRTSSLRFFKLLPLSKAEASPEVPVLRDSMNIDQRRREIVASLGKPARLLVGLGSTDPVDILAQQVTPDLFDVYLTGLGPTNSWRGWNKPDGEYLQMKLRDSAKVGAVPMLTVYQIATGGENNLDVLGDSKFMQMYWGDFHRLMLLLKAYNKPVLLNIEPDFWGYTLRKNPDPTTHFAHVGNVYDECGRFGNTVTAMVQCMVHQTRKHVPKARIGFPAPGFLDLINKQIPYMRKLGADQADFGVMQTGDRDAGCYEVGKPPCANSRDPIVMYWDETNTKNPNFNQHFSYASNYSRGINLPLIWWQTPLGAKSSQFGGRPFAYRDSKVHYFLTHGAQVVDAGGFGVVFSPGEKTQTELRTDGGQFKTYSKAYFSAPTPLP